MQMIQCPNCGRLTGFKRALGFGTFFMVVLTCGLWLLAIPLYPARCMNCGLTRGSAVTHNFRAWFWSLNWASRICVVLAPLALLFGIGAFNAFRNSAQLNTPATHIDNSPSTSNATSPAAPSQDSQSAQADGNPDDHELHLVHNLFGRGAVSDRRTYSIALIASHMEQIPPATTLFVQGTILGKFGTDVIVLADEQEKSNKLLCAMSPDESEDVSYYYHSGEPVQATGSFGVSSFGLPVLRDCTVASATDKVVRPLYVAPAAEQSAEEQNQNSEDPKPSPEPQSQDEVTQSATGQAQTQSIRIPAGATPDEVVAILGQPVSITTGAKHVYSYPHLNVFFVSGKVSYIQQF